MGILEGESVGPAVGRKEGDSVGVAVGENEGICEGRRVGEKLGEAVGLWIAKTFRILQLPRSARITLLAESNQIPFISLSQELTARIFSPLYPPAI